MWYAKKRGRKATKKPVVRKGVKRVYKRSTVDSMVKRALTKYTPKVEKKSYDVSVGQVQQQVGQVNGNSSGHWVFEVNPIPANGTSQVQMIGNEIQLTSVYYDFQFISQSAMTLGQKIKMYFVHVKGLPINVASFASMFLDPTNFITASSVYDYNSPRNVDYIKNFRVLGTRTAYLKPDNYGTQGNTFARVKGGLKFKTPITIKFSGNISEGQILILAVADNGNTSPSTASTISNIPTTAINTGTNFYFSWRNYYTDA